MQEINWNINSLSDNKEEGDIIIILPIQGNPIILTQDQKEIPKNIKNLRYYIGSEELAVRMIFFEKGKVYISPKENPEEMTEYIEKINSLGIPLIAEKTNIVQNGFANSNTIQENVITGLTKNTEGTITIDENTFATTSIGKTRENQEDAVALFKMQTNPNYKMLIVADGMGGWKKGENASNAVIESLKEWFENLDSAQRKCFETGLSALSEEVKKQIAINTQISVENATYGIGGSTIVIALVGEKDTLIANIGDSRAYISKAGKLIQVSREDTVTQGKIEKGLLPDKEAGRFDEESNILTHCLGESRKTFQNPHIELINNEDYEMLMLFSDGVTDCLSEEEIAVVCRTTDKKKLTEKIVERAITKDSIQPEKYQEYTGLNSYISGGKDNATAAIYVK